MKDNTRKYKYRKSEKGKISAVKYKQSKKKRCRKLINAIKEYNGCLNADCHWIGKYDAVLLDFHHLDRNEKSVQIGSSDSRSFKFILEEAKKCTVLCANCHRLATWKNLDLSGCEKCKLPEKFELYLAQVNISAKTAWRQLKLD
jgi:hypothetical protein